MVTNEAVELACNEVSDYSEQQMASEFERFFKAQPELCDFIVELTSDSEQKVQELVLFLSYMVFKSVEKAGSPDVPAVTHVAIEDAFRESERWIEKINQGEGEAVQSSIVPGPGRDAEPYLLQYVISEINQTLEDGTFLGDEQKGEVFFVMKTVISTLARRLFETETAEEN